MSDSAQAIREFIEQLARFPGSWQSIDLRVATTTVAGQEFCIICKGTFGELPPDCLDPTPPDPSVPGFTVERIVLPFAQIAELVQDMQQGKLVLRGRTILLCKPTRDGTVKEAFGLGFEFLEAGGRFNPSTTMATIRLHCYNQSLQDASACLLNESTLARSWNALRAPYKDMEDVLSEYFRALAPHGSSKSFFKFEAPVPLEFSPATSWKNNRLTFTVSAGSGLTSEGVSIGLICTPRDGAKTRESILGSELQWTNQGARRVASVLRDMPDVTSCELYLRYETTTVAIKELNNPQARTNNVPLIVHRYFDPTLAHYEKYIAGLATKPQRPFEIAMGWQLMQCGFGTSFYGTGQDFENEIDLIAYWEEGKTLLGVECTTSSTDLKRKMSNIFQRCKELKRLVPTWEVVPVVATSQASTQISDTECHTAWTDQVVLLASKEIKGLLQLAEKNCSPQQALDYLLQGGAAKAPPHNHGGVHSLPQGEFWHRYF